MKQRHLAILTLLLFFLLAPGTLYPKSAQQSSHADNKKLPKGCASCHVGHGKPNTPMLPEKKEVFCFKCHGREQNRVEARKRGELGRETKSFDLQREFEKAYHHPIEKTGIHRYNETLPERDSSKERHSECVDCHHHHYVTEKNKSAGIKGTGLNRTRVNEVVSDYELCFNCHLNSANLPATQIGKMELFDTTNTSFHPVTAPGKNRDVPSLLAPLTVSSLIKCTDCHNNDEPRGPRGPHGSKYRYILARNYTDTDGLEGPSQYELCYGCHRRSSILANESFQYHNLHVTTVGVSCRTCHNSHGSARHTNLIDFNNNSAIRASKSGRLEFISLGRRAGQCYLNCHGHDHDPGQYPKTQQKATDRKLPATIPAPGPFDFRRLK